MMHRWTKRSHSDEPGKKSDDSAHSSQLQAALDRSEQLVDTLQETVRLLKAQIHALEAQLPGGPLLQGGQLHGGQFLGAAAAAAPSDAPPGIQQFHGGQLHGAAAPAAPPPPGSPSSPRRPPVCHHHWPQRQNIRSAQLAMDGGWVVEPGPGSDTQISAFFNHLGSTLFSADARGHSRCGTVQPRTFQKGVYVSAIAPPRPTGGQCSSVPTAAPTSRSTMGIGLSKHSKRKRRLGSPC